MQPNNEPSAAPCWGMDLVSAGETMVMLVPDPPRPMDGRTRYQPTAAGAESNVAAFAAALGVRSAWVSRLGRDVFGTYVLEELTRQGVDVSAVETDGLRPTAVAFKEVSKSETQIAYFREGSAASAMDLATAERVRRMRGRVLHLTGITAALSSSCAGFLESLHQDRAAGSILSFDVNWRPSLWRGRDHSILLELARSADVVFVGEDEAEAAWRVCKPSDVRRLLPEVHTLVVKQGAYGATAFVGAESVFVPSLAVDVVESVGAGDAFAAGFLVGTLRQLPLKERMRLGTIVAAAALRVPTDVGPLPSNDHIEALLALDDSDWSLASVEAQTTQMER